MATKKELDAQEAKRRRRKKTGLRVPSDDVPRRATSESDPRLAVSLASAFGAEAAAVVEDSDELDADAQQPSVSLDQLGGGRPATSGDSVDIAFDDGDIDDEEELTEADDLGELEDSESGAVARPVDDEAVAAALADDIEDISEEVEEVHEGPRTDEIAAVAAPEEAASHQIVDDGRKTELMPAMSDAEVGWEEDEPSAPGVELSVPSASISAGWSAPTPTPAPEPALAEPVPIAAAAPPEAVPEEIPAEAESSDVTGEAEEEDDDDDDLDLPVVEAEPVVEAPPEALAAEEPAAVGATLEPGDASDSGELLTDDLIEEYEQGSQNAPRVPVSSSAAQGDARAQTVLEPVEELTPSDVVEVDSGPNAAATESSPTPPKPAPAPPKPPPAPPRGAAAAQRASAPRRRGKPWFEEIFDEDYLRTLPFLTPQQTQKQSAFVIAALGIKPGDSVLDVGCGYGRHAMELAARGYHVVGLDASLPLLIRGADEAQRRGLTINFVHGDMRELTFEDQFDGAYCLFGTFGYFDDETNRKAAQAIARALKPGARFVVEVLNRDYLISDLPSRVWWEGDGCVVLEEVEFNYFSSRIVSNRSVVFDDGRQLEQEISMRAYSLHEMGKLLHAAGFRILELSGSMDTKGRFFGNQSRELVVVCERRAGRASANDTTPRTPVGDDEEMDNDDRTLPGTGGE